jgi:hypothetical protein
MDGIEFITFLAAQAIDRVDEAVVKIWRPSEAGQL